LFSIAVQLAAGINRAASASTPSPGSGRTKTRHRRAIAHGNQVIHHLVAERVEVGDQQHATGSEDGIAERDGEAGGVQGHQHHAPHAAELQELALQISAPAVLFPKAQDDGQAVSGDRPGGTARGARLASPRWNQPFSLAWSTR
jgi:hypothetical protein